MATAPSPRPITEAVFIRRVLIVVGIVAFAVALYLLSDILLLAFGDVLVAIVLHAIARPLRRNTPLSDRLALGAAVLTVIAVLGGIGYLYGVQIASQLAGLFDTSRPRWRACRNRRPSCRYPSWSRAPPSAIW